jgi:antitoxin component YwqK of YwqJK toxin-antitoxin module
MLFLLKIKLMRNYLLLFFLVALSAFSFSQSKKEQIELLNSRIDSINQVLSAETKTSADKSAKITDLDSKIANLEKEKTTLNGTISKLNGEITSLNSSINQLKSELAATKSSLDNSNNVVASKNQEISNLTAQVKTKSDSLKLVQNELVKLKPAPKQTTASLNTSSLKRYMEDDVTMIWEGSSNPIVLKSLLSSTGVKEKINGIVYGKYGNGILSREYSYKDGLWCGPYKNWLLDGRLESEGNYIIRYDIYPNGQSYPDGIQKKYHGNGRLKRKTDYRNGTAWEDRCYDENGDELKPCPKNY